MSTGIRPCVLGVLICLVALSSSVNGLTSEEEAALADILQSFPSLRQINPADQFDNLNNDWGGSWTKPVAEICADGDGWAVQGIHCFGGHVDAIRLTGSFGFRSEINPNISGLTWVTNFTCNIEASSYGDWPAASEFMALVFGLPSLRSVNIESFDSTHFPASAFESANLTHVSLLMYFDAYISFAQMRYLEEVTLLNDIDNFTQFINSAGTLRSLVLSGETESTNGLSQLAALESLHSKFVGIVPAGLKTFPIPSGLKFLSLDGWYNASLRIGTAGSTLESLMISPSFDVGNVTFIPSTLKRLVVRGWGARDPWATFPSPRLLEHFEMIDTGMMSIPEQLYSCNNLKSLILNSVHVDSLGVLAETPLSMPSLELLQIESQSFWPNTGNLDFAGNWLCSVPTTLKHLSLYGTNFYKLPSCVSNWTSLETLNIGVSFAPTLNSFVPFNITSSLKELVISIDAIGYDPQTKLLNINWDMLERFPGLVKLTVTQGESWPTPFPGETISNLQSLQELSLSGLGLTGSIPRDFFRKLGNLKSCLLASNLLNGTIPSDGLSNLTSLWLNDNQFSAWPSVNVTNGPMEMEELLVNANHLESLPSDAQFMSMPKLRVLAANSNYLTTFPIFWANGGHKLKSLFLSNCAFSGPFPTPINTPYLRVLNLGQNKFCGPLPEFTGPSSFSSVQFESNRFTGSIPSSWRSNLTISAIFLRNNVLSGPIPDSLVSAQRTPVLRTIDLSNNYFTGTVPNLSSHVNLASYLLEGQNTTANFCANDPKLPASLIICRLFLESSSICTCAPWYTTCDGVDSFCDVGPAYLTPPFGPISTPIAVIPPNVTCMMPPATPFEAPTGGDLNCALPSPGSSFYCDNGTWKSRGSVTQPTITIPGSSQPGNPTIVIVGGNLTITQGGVTFIGFEAQLIINGCIFLSDNKVTIELTAEEVEKLAKEGKISKTLIATLSDNGCFGSSDLTGTKVVVTKGSGSKGCRKVKAKNNGSTISSLNVIFEIDNSTCNMIIIIPSVIGGVLIIAGVALAVGLYLRHLRLQSYLNKP